MFLTSGHRYKAQNCVSSVGRRARAVNGIAHRHYRSRDFTAGGQRERDLSLSTRASRTRSSSRMNRKSLASRGKWWKENESRTTFHQLTELIHIISKSGFIVIAYLISERERKKKERVRVREFVCVQMIVSVCVCSRRSSSWPPLAFRPETRSSKKRGHRHNDITSKRSRDCCSSLRWRLSR